MTNLPETTPDLPAAIRPALVRPWPLGELAAGLADVPPELRALPVADLAYDSRRATPGCLYVGLPGAKAHGAAFAAQAAAAGAVVILTDAAGAILAEGAGLPELVVADPRVTMAHLAARLFGDPTAHRLTFGMTGTTGKSTTCFLLDAALREHGHHVGYVGTIGFLLDGRRLPVQRTTPTTPESPDLQAALAAMAEQGADSFVMEASSAGLALDRVEAVDFDVVGFSNLGRDHLDFHPTMEDYFQAKAKLFRPGWARRAVVNIDDAAGRRLVGMIRQAGSPQVTTVGRAEEADFRLLELTPGADGRQHVTFSHDGQETRFLLDLPGDFNVANAMLALAMMDAAGFPSEPTLRGIAHTAVPGRMERVDLGPDAPRVFIDFGHTPEATEAALRAIPRPTIAVLGSSGDRDKGKRPLIGAAAARQADVVMVTDDNARTEDPASIRAAVLAGAREQAAQTDHPVQVIDGGDRGSAIKQALAMADVGWSVVVLGCGDREFLETGNRLIPFRDATVVQTAWDELRKERA